MSEIKNLTLDILKKHWNFTSLPFPKIAGNDVFLPDQINEAVIRLNQLLETRDVGIVVGEAGTGKSTLIDLILSQVTQEHFRVIHLPLPQNKVRELYRGIASALGVNTTMFGADAMKVVELLNFSFMESKRPSLLLIDEAHLLGHICLNELRLLTNTRVGNEALVTMMLFGQPSLVSTLKLPAMIPLTQRVGVWVNLNGLSESETADYIRWQLEKAGTQKEIFSPAAMKGIFRFAQGNPRLINRIAWECLNQGCLDDAQIVNEVIFADVCKNIGPHLAN